MSSGHDDGLPEEHEEHANHEAWVIPYADLLTLLMAMFIALFAMSTVDVSKAKAVAAGFNDALNGPSLDKGVFSAASNDTPLSASGAAANSTPSGGTVGLDTPNSKLKQFADQHTNLQAAHTVEQQSLRAVEKQIQQKAAQLGLAGKLNLTLEDNGLVVTLLTDQVLFDSGSALVKPQGDNLLQVVEQALTGIDNPLEIIGYTDSNPINSAQYPSNWELSSARADAVVRFFESIGMDRTRMNPKGRADLDPVASNATPEGQAQNRRVEIVVQSKLIARALADANLTSKAVSNAKTNPIGSPVGNPVPTGITPTFGSR
ncbi:MAG: flagellar motor rotation protein MotB [Actinomycetia bacterium]|nr:flagellar motor rotation protein MotB [Actinomycetes bacterium]